MTGDTLLFLGMGAVAGGFINGLSGTGTALFALGFFLIVLDPVTAVAIVTLMAVLAGVQGLWEVRRAIWARPRRLLRFLLPSLVGIPLGLTLLDVIDARSLRIAIAAFLILYGVYFGARAALPAFTRRTPLLDMGVGFVGGLLGGAAGVSGAVPSMWLSLRPWPKAETRAVLQPLNFVILGTTVCLLAWRGAYDATALRALMIVLPVGLASAFVGIVVFRRLSDAGFRRLLIGLTFLVGVGIMASAVF